MSEKIYAWLLRLYPSHFRKDYGGEALQLLRDRARNEKGFLPTIWLWLDLLADLVVSLPREYHYVQRAAIVAAAQPGSDNVPSFHVLKGESPRFAALLLGGVLSLVTLGALPIGISYFGNHLGFGSIFYGQPAITATGRSGGDTPLGDFESDLLPQQRSNSAAQLLEPSSSLNAGMIGAIKQNLKLDRAARRRVIAKIIEYLNRYYIDPDVAEKIADALQTHEKNGEYDAVTNGAAFADLLTRQMRDVSRDGQLIVIYSQITALDPPPRPTPEETAQYRREMEANNCTFETVRILPHNIGYLKLNSFPDASICRRTATAAMASLNDADAIIFDLRDNPGGYANMVALLATYLFDQPTHLNDFYNRGANSTEQSWTLPPVAGNRLTDKPAYVLTSATSFSAAEAFSYDLKILNRATLVGETTSGRNHMGMAHRIDDHFIVRVPGIRVTNPISKTSWEGTGVEPNVNVKAADALAVAKKLAWTKLQKR